MNLTKEEKQLKVWMLISTIMYTGSGLYFLFFHDLFFKQLNEISRIFFDLPPVPLPVERFWLALSIGLMAAITVCCYLAYKDIKKNIVCIPPLLASKLASSLTGVYFFFVNSYFAHIVIFMSDFPIFVVTLVLYLRAKK